MRGLFSSRRGSTLYLLVCFGLGLALAGAMVLASAAAWPNALLVALPVTLVYGVGAGFSAFYLCRAYPLSERAPLLLLGVMTVAALCSGVLWLAIVQVWNTLLLAFSQRWAGIAMTPALSGGVVATGVLLYGLSVAVHYLVHEFVRARAAEQRQLESQLMAQEAELRMLRTQIDPHFLFNSLNSISALTSVDAAGARLMTQQLASFFRLSLSLGSEAQQKITLAQELVLIRHFLAIEQVRFGERLRVEESVLAPAGDCLLPPMLIQPLVENAVKHGICNLIDGGAIRIAVRCDGSLLRIEVVNDIDVDQPAPAPGGIGLNNVRQRLASVYRHEASIHWGRRGQAFMVDISMPVELAGEQT